MTTLDYQSRLKARSGYLRDFFATCGRASVSIGVVNLGLVGICWMAMLGEICECVFLPLGLCGGTALGVLGFIMGAFGVMSRFETWPMPTLGILINPILIMVAWSKFFWVLLPIC